MVQAATFGSFDYYIDGGEVIITRYHCDSDTVAIPAEIEGLPVTTIGQNAFNSCGTITSVTIPDSVNTIGESAFNSCWNLASVTFSDFLTTIGETAFYNCQQLGNPSFPDTLVSIGRFAFGSCLGFTELTLPDSVTTIEEKAFAYCSNLTAVNLPASVTVIGAGAFSNCSSLTEFIVDAANPEYSTLDGVLFNDNITTLVQFPAGLGGQYIIPASVTSIGDGAFFGCYNLNDITFPDSVTSIGNEAFYYCLGLYSLSLPDSLVSIGNLAFEDCYYISGLVLPDSLTTIGDLAFKGCYRLYNIFIPENVVSIGNGPFAYCYHLTQIDVSASNTAYTSHEGVLYDKSMQTLVQYPTGLAGEFAVPGTVKTIGAYSFSYAKSLTGISIPDSVTHIEEYAFSDCEVLADVIIPESVSYLGDFAFRDADGIQTVTIPGNLSYFGIYIFDNCQNISSVYFLGDPPMDRYYTFNGVPSEVTVYYIEGIRGWEDIFYMTVLVPFDPAWLWGRYPFIVQAEDTFADTGEWLGMFEVSLRPWVWHADTNLWFNVVEPVAAAGEGWMYVPDLTVNEVPLSLVMQGDSDYGFSHGLNKWVYVNPGGIQNGKGWVYLFYE